jgi:site-specific DNA-cytosine methylase
LNKPTWVSLFAGGGGADLGAIAAGFQPVGAVEWNVLPKLGGPDAIASAYADNIGDHVIVDRVECADPTPFAGVDALWASPVCTAASIANPNRGEREIDIRAAQGVCNWLRIVRPKIFVMENVTQYRVFEACKLIERCLSELGYFHTANNVNSADMGVPQSRRRLIIRAVRDGLVPPLPQPVKHIGWYAAIEDLLPGLKDSEFADWQLKRLPAEYSTTFVADMCSTARDATVRQTDEPIFTLTGAQCGRRAASQPRAFLHMTGNTQLANPSGTGVLEKESPANTVNSMGGGTYPRAFLVAPNSNEKSWGDNQRDGEEPAFSVAGNAPGRTRAFLANDQSGTDHGLQTPDGDTPATTVRGGGSPPRAFLANGTTNNRGEDMTTADADEPCFTVGASSTKRPVRAWLSQGRVVMLDIRCLARFQTFPDWYRLPERRLLASAIIGNAVPCLLSQRIMEGLRDCL